MKTQDEIQRSEEVRSVWGVVSATLGLQLLLLALPFLAVTSVFSHSE